MQEQRQCFNPCFNGTYSLTQKQNVNCTNILISFNPCFNGTYSLTVGIIIGKVLSMAF